MGQTLSEPITAKQSESGQNDYLHYGYSSMQGWRLTMEDSHCAILNLKAPEKSDKHPSLFAVFDGHGGHKVAVQAAQRIADNLTTLKEYQHGDYPKAMVQAFLELDEELKRDNELRTSQVGATAVSCLVFNDRLICANAGDSRCIIGKRGQAVPLSYDHKPANKTEFDRIRNAGGFVEFGRVNGNLALSRALGDFEFKNNANLPAEKQIVTAYPDIIEHKLDESVDFMVLACDGIWDCMSNQEVVDFVQQKICQGKDLKEICEDVLDFCLAPDSFIGAVGCDNMSIIIVAFLGKKSKEEWISRCKETVNETPVLSTHRRDDAAPNVSAAVSTVTTTTTAQGVVLSSTKDSSQQPVAAIATSTTTTTTTTATASAKQAEPIKSPTGAKKLNRRQS